MFVFIVNSSVYHYLKDYLERVCWYLSKFNVKAEIIQYSEIELITYGRPREAIPEKFTNIVHVQRVNPKMIPGKILGLTRKMFLLNTEQASVSGYRQNVLADIKRYNPTVIDYSRENIEILHEHSPETQFIHFPYPFKFTKPAEKTIDVVSLLSSEHRQKVCGELGIPVTDFNGLWGKERDELIRKSRVLLNLHFDPEHYNVLETIRCYGALEQGTLVVTETCFNKDLVLLRDHITFSSTDDLPRVVKEVLENYTDIQKRIFGRKNIRRIEQLIYDTFEQSIKMLF